MFSNNQDFIQKLKKKNYFLSIFNSKIDLILINFKNYLFLVRAIRKLFSKFLLLSVPWLPNSLSEQPETIFFTKLIFLKTYSGFISVKF